MGGIGILWALAAGPVTWAPVAFFMSAFEGAPFDEAWVTGVSVSVLAVLAVLIGRLLSRAARR